MTWAWGIDPDTKGAHFAVLNLETGKFQTNSAIWDGLHVSPGRRLMECRMQTIRFSEAMVQHFPPSIIAVELPIGFRKQKGQHALMMHAGVIAEAIGTGTTLAPFFLSTKEWRKPLGLPGGGNATKAQVVEWAQSIGWKLGRVDQAEALGIAFAAKQVLDGELAVAA